MVRKQKDNKLFKIGLGVVILIGVLGFTFSAIPFGGHLGADGASTTYNGHRIEALQTGGFGTEVNDQEIFFFNLPERVERIDADSEVFRMLRSSRVIQTSSNFTSDLATPIAGAQYQLDKVLDTQFDSTLQIGFTQETDLGFPVFDCANATDLVPILLFEQNNKTGIILDGNCIRVRGKSESTLNQARDRLMYGLLGIIE